MSLMGLVCFQFLIQSDPELPGSLIFAQKNFVGQEVFLIPSLKCTCAHLTRWKIWCSEHETPKQMKRKILALPFTSLIQQQLSGFKLCF